MMLYFTCKPFVGVPWWVFPRRVEESIFVVIFVLIFVVLREILDIDLDDRESNILCDLANGLSDKPLNSIVQCCSLNISAVH